MSNGKPNLLALGVLVLTLSGCPPVPPNRTAGPVGIALAGSSATAETGSRGTASPLGEILFSTHSCNTCHRETAVGVGGALPLNGSWGTQVALVDGRSVSFDEVFVRRSLIDPQADRRTLDRSPMPSYANLEEEDIAAIVELYESRKGR